MSNLTANNSRSQRCGGQCEVAYGNAIRVKGRWGQLFHRFTGWAAGDVISWGGGRNGTTDKRY